MKKLVQLHIVYKLTMTTTTTATMKKNLLSLLADDEFTFGVVVATIIDWLDFEFVGSSVSFVAVGTRHEVDKVFTMKA